MSVILRRQYVQLCAGWLSMLELRDVSVRDLRSFITERGFSHAGLLERHELEARADGGQHTDRQTVCVSAGVSVCLAMQGQLPQRCLLLANSTLATE